VQEHATGCEQDGGCCRLNEDQSAARLQVSASHPVAAFEECSIVSARDPQRGQDPGGQRSQCGGEYGDSGHSHVEGQPVGERHERNTRGADCVERPRGEDEPRGAADECQHRRFDDLLSQQPCARRAHGGAHRELSSPGDAARQQQSADVRARDEEDTHDRREQREQRRPDTAHEAFPKRHDGHTPSGVGVRVHGREPRRDDAQAIGRRRQPLTGR
jgi:hypothetical protein